MALVLLKSRGWCIFVISLLQYQAVYSQDSSYLIQHFTNENGLPVNGITAIELDKPPAFYGWAPRPALYGSME